MEKKSLLLPSLSDPLLVFERGSTWGGNGHHQTGSWAIHSICGRDLLGTRPLQKPSALPDAEDGTDCKICAYNAAAI
jgi:hypothetical protein